MGYKENAKLLDRVVKFAESIIDLCNKLPRNIINNQLIPQTIGCTSSIGANYSEACEAESAKDFIHKIKIVLKEIKESIFFLKLILKANPTISSEISNNQKEANELLKIFSSIASRFRSG